MTIRIVVACYSNDQSWRFRDRSRFRDQIFAVAASVLSRMSKHGLGLIPLSSAVALQLRPPPPSQSKRKSPCSQVISL